MRRTPHTQAALAVMACAALYALPAPARLPGKLSSKPADAPAAASAPVEQNAAAEIRKAEAAARARLAVIEAGGSAPADAPPGTPPFEITTRITYARQLVSLYDKQQNTLERLEKARERLRETQHATESWRGFDDRPPRSVLLIDGLRDELDAAEHALGSARETRALFERLEADFSSKIKAAQAEARLAAEAAERARGSPSFARVEWERNLAAGRAEVDLATQALLQLGLRAAQLEQQAAEAAREFARRKLIAAGSEIAVPRADIDRALAEIEHRRLVAERLLERAATQFTAAQSALDAVESSQAAERAVAAASARGTARLAELDRELAVAREVAATAKQRVFLLRERLVTLEAERVIWDARVQAITLRDPVQARNTHARLTDGLSGLRATKQYLEQQLTTVAGRIRDEEARQRFQDPEITADRRLLQTLRERESDLRTALEAGAPIERLVAHFRADFEGRRDITATERAKDALAGAWLAGRQLWNFEMFTIDDTLHAADGRKIAVSRGVTVGKTFGAVLIVVIGYLLSDLLLRWLERRRVAAGRTSAQAAALARRWILFLLTAVLVIFALFVASIPLTAFAFLGGALAIAAGFGLQTLLKNLVSGVMLLVERPMRLGDMVEVDGLRGRVTEIGLRASTIRSGDGMESIVPNSRFLEGNMTNWTYTNSTARQTIDVGVEYGSPLRQVSEILSEVVARHGLVLKEPAPQVYLAGYGDSAINFSLNYWVDMTEQADGARIKSDLLHMIDRAFDEAGIAIPFPQRDVRLTAAEPVPVAVVASAPARSVSVR